MCHDLSVIGPRNLSGLLNANRGKRQVLPRKTSGSAAIFVRIKDLKPRNLSGLTPINVRIVSSSSPLERNRVNCQDCGKRAKVRYLRCGPYSRSANGRIKPRNLSGFSDCGPDQRLKTKTRTTDKEEELPLVARSARLKLCGYKTAPAANSTSPNGLIKIKSQCTPEKEGITCQRQLTGKDDARLRENSTDFLRRLMRCLVDTNFRP